MDGEQRSLPHHWNLLKGGQRSQLVPGEHFKLKHDNPVYRKPLNLLIVPYRKYFNFEILSKMCYTCLEPNKNMCYLYLEPKKQNILGHR